jgi:hypothetical protein
MAQITRRNALAFLTAFALTFGGALALPSMSASPQLQAGLLEIFRLFAPAQPGGGETGTNGIPPLPPPDDSAPAGIVSGGEPYLGPPGFLEGIPPEAGDVIENVAPQAVFDLGTAAVPSTEAPPAALDGELCSFTLAPDCTQGASAICANGTTIVYTCMASAPSTFPFHEAGADAPPGPFLPRAVSAEGTVVVELLEEGIRARDDVTGNEAVIPPPGGQAFLGHPGLSSDGQTMAVLATGVGGGPPSLLHYRLYDGTTSALLLSETWDAAVRDTLGIEGSTVFFRREDGSLLGYDLDAGATFEVSLWELPPWIRSSRFAEAAPW